MSILFLIPMTFLLGWWLTHPYKKERAVYQMPVAQPYGQPVYQSVGAFDAVQKVICINCGRKLLPDEIFCVNCGTRRPEPPWAEPDDAEQKAFCTGCGKELSVSEEFCSACSKQRIPTQEQPSAVSEEAPQTPSFVWETVFCMQCGAAMDSHSMFRMKCGARLKNDPE